METNFCLAESSPLGKGGREVSSVEVMMLNSISSVEEGMYGAQGIQVHAMYAG